MTYKKKDYLLLTILIISIIQIGYSQKKGELQNFRLRIVERNTEQPISEVQAYIDGTLDIVEPEKSDYNGNIVFPQVLTIGKFYEITLLKKEYIPIVQQIKVSETPSLNFDKIYLERNKNVILFGKVKDKKRRQPISGASVNLTIAGKPFESTTDGFGNYRFVIQRELGMSRKAIINVIHPRFRISAENEKSESIEDAAAFYRNDFSLEKKNLDPNKVTFWSSIGLTLALESYGWLKFYFDANPLYNDYKNNLREEDFLKLQPEFETREDGYQSAEAKRRTAKGAIIAGGITIIPALISGYIILKRNSKSADEDLQGNQLNLFGLKAKYHFGQDSFIGIAFTF